VLPLYIAPVPACACLCPWVAICWLPISPLALPACFLNPHAAYFTTFRPSPCSHLADLLVDEERTDSLIHEHNGLYVDFSRQNLTETTIQVRGGGWMAGEWGPGGSAAANCAWMWVACAAEGGRSSATCA
jgi:hypothetical protein